MAPSGRGFLLRLSIVLACTGVAVFVLASLISHPDSTHATLVPGTSCRLGPYMLALESFETENDADGSVADYVSRIIWHDASGGHAATVRVGHPAVMGGWSFFQSDCGFTREGERTSTLLCVRDVLVPVKAIGLWALLAAGLLMIAGALSDFLSGKGRHGYGRIIVPLCTVFAIVFAWMVLGSVGVGRHSLPPVLRSSWFAPHLAAYIAGYSVMATATVIGILSIRKETLSAPLRLLVRIGFGLLTCGLVLGALWASKAWGTFWAWDPKETWALATWLCYALFLLLPEKKWRIAVLLCAFLLLQMCWWGVRLLPSASASMHLYG